MATPKFYNHIPDACLVVSILLAFGVATFAPQTGIFPWSVRIAGWLLLVMAFVMLFVAFASLKKQRTSTNPIDAPTQLVTKGLYAFSRNPLYLAYILVALGSALAAGSWLALFVPIICFVIIDRLIIPVEEEQMKRVFGAAYTRYARAARRWI